MYFELYSVDYLFFCYIYRCSYKIVWFIIYYILYINKLLFVRINYLFIFVDDFNNWLFDNMRNVIIGIIEREIKFYYYFIIIGFI